MLRLVCITPDYGGLHADFPETFVGSIPALDGRTAVWLGNGYTQIAGASVGFSYSVSDGFVQNVRTDRRYDYVQHAITDANNGDTIVAGAGLHEQKFDFAGKSVTVRSTDPNDPRVVAATVFHGGGSVVSFVEGEGSGSVLAGVTLTGGQGIYAYGTSPTVTRCVIANNLGAGVRLLGGGNPTIANCQILANGGAGVDLSSPASESRAAKQAQVTLRNCLIAANRGQGVRSGKPTLINCTVVENRLEGVATLTPTIVNSILYLNDGAGDKTQIDGKRAAVSYSDVEGGYPGDGNIDANPLFVAWGRWAAPAGSSERIGAFDSGAVWTPGDYHLKSQGWRWDPLTSAWVTDDATSPCIDAGDPASELLDEPLTAPGNPAGPVLNLRIDMGAYGGTAEASLAPANR